MIVSATRIRIRGLAGWFRFFRIIGRIRRQLDAAEGLRFAKFRGLTTLTGWDSRAAMQAFRNQGAHLEAMRNTRTIGIATVVTWECTHEPDWAEAEEQLRQREVARESQS